MADDKLSRQQLAEEFEKIRAQCKELGKEYSAETAYDIIEADPNHPLRRFLQWNNDVAGREYRIWQVQNLMRRVTIPVTIGETQVRTPLFVHSNPVPGEQHARMVDLHTAARDSEIALEVAENELRQALGQVERARNVIAGLKQYPETVQTLHRQSLEIQELLERLVKKSEAA